MSTLTTRASLRKAALSDAADAAVLAGQLADDVDAKMLIWAAGTTGGMPASALDGKLYHDTTADRLLYDMGTTWRKILYQAASGDYKADNPVDATGFKVSGTSLAASHLSNGVTGSGSVVLATTPTLVGVPLSTTPSVDDNTTKIATTAYVVGQAGASNPLMNSSVAVGTSLRYSRQDHVHPVDTSRAPLVSPTFTGTPAAPTAGAGTNTTQIATTAFVQANGKHIEGGHGDYASGDTAISFATAFAATPSIALGYDTRNDTDPDNFVATFKNPSTTGFTMKNPAGGNRLLNWIAI